MPKEEAATLATYCEEKGYTKAGFIRQAIKEKSHIFIIYGLKYTSKQFIVYFIAR